MAKRDDISCCPNCGRPLVWTFINPGAEYFCWRCKGEFGMMSADKKNWTATRANNQQKDEKEFKKARKHFIPPQSYRADCDKCDDRKSSHRSHATEKQLNLHEEAEKLIWKK